MTRSNPTDEQRKAAKSRAVDSSRVEEVFRGVFTSLMENFRESRKVEFGKGGVYRAIPAPLLHGTTHDATVDAFEILTEGLYGAAAKSAEYELDWKETEKFQDLD